MEFSEEETKQIFKIFKDECEEHVGNINRCLLNLEKSPEDIDLITELFREAHSIKGSARMLDVVSIQTLAHKVEDLLGFAKEGTIVVNSNIIDIIYKSMDTISKILEKINYNTLDYVDEESDLLSAQIDKLKEKILSGQFENSQNKKDNISDIKTDINDVTGQTEKESAISTEAELLLHYIEQFVNKYQRDNAIKEIICIIDNKLDESSSQINKDILLLIKENISYIQKNDITPSREIITAISDSLLSSIIPGENEDLNLILQRQTILKQMLELSKENYQIASLSQMKSSNELEQINQKSSDYTKRESTYETGIFKTLRVDTQKLDKLENQVEELIVFKIKNKQHLSTINSMITEITDLQKILNKTLTNHKYVEKKFANTPYIQEKTSYLKSSFSHIEKINEMTEKLYSITDKFQKHFLNDDIHLNFLTEEFENTVKSIRILPLATIFHMFPRMVRDISREQGKQIEMIVTGSETSADKTIIEEIKSPLIHIIRNAIDHGIETPEERIKAGKNPMGKIILNSYHAGNTIIIEVIDDGKGLNTQKIKEKAISKKLFSPEELNQLTETQIMNLIFWPGFTTGDTVTEISGRGVGLDVVHTKISQLDGKVSIISEEGTGFKIVIKIPITLATLKALLVNAGNQIFAIPSSYVKTVLSVKNGEIINKEGKPQIVYNGNSIKLIKLTDLLDMEGTTQELNKKNIVVIQVEDTMLAVEVDNFMRTEEILQKKLNPPLTRVKNISGVSSLSGGETCLILNLNDIIKSSLSNKEFSKKATIINMPVKKVKIPKILIIDDSYTTLTLGKNILKNQGYKVYTATNGTDALGIINYEKMDLIITDLEMPVMSGYELIEKIRNTGIDVPIIVLSSQTGGKIQEKCLALGANNYISKKDFSEKLVLDMVKEYLKD